MICVVLIFSGCVNPIGSTTGTNAVQTRTITVDNGALMYPMVNIAANDYMSLHGNDKIIVNNNDTSGASIKLLISNKTDIAGASRAPLIDELQSAKVNNVDLHMTRIGGDAVCVVVNPSNPVDDLNISQLNDIFFTGNITNWSQVTNGLATGPIHVYVVNSSGSSISWQLNHDVNTGDAIGFINQDNVNKSQSAIMPMVIDDPDGITIGSLGYLNSSYKAIKINGISPSKATVQDTSYPIRLQLYMITNGEPNGLSMDFINYLLSMDGQKLVENADLIPIM